MPQKGTHQPYFKNRNRILAQVTLAQGGCHLLTAPRIGRASPEPPPLDERLSLEQDLMRCLYHWKSLPHVSDIRITFSGKYEYELEPPLRTLLCDFLAHHNQEVEAKRKQLTKLDLTGTYSSFEERVVRHEGKTKVYNEPWIEKSELEKIKKINELIHSELINQSMLQPRTVIDAIDNYKRAFYRF